MSNTFGRHLKITLFGESHGPSIGAILDGLPGGVKIDEEYIASRMQLRRAVGTSPPHGRKPIRFIFCPVSKTDTVREHPLPL